MRMNKWMKAALSLCIIRVLVLSTWPTHFACRFLWSDGLIWLIDWLDIYGLIAGNAPLISWPFHKLTCLLLKKGGWKNQKQKNKVELGIYIVKARTSVFQEIVLGSIKTRNIFLFHCTPSLMSGNIRIATKLWVSFISWTNRHYDINMNCVPVLNDTANSKYLFAPWSWEKQNNDYKYQN